MFWSAVSIDLLPMIGRTAPGYIKGLRAWPMIGQTAPGYMKGLRAWPMKWFTLKLTTPPQTVSVTSDCSKSEHGNFVRCSKCLEGTFLFVLFRSFSSACLLTPYLRFTSAFVACDALHRLTHSHVEDYAQLYLSLCLPLSSLRRGHFWVALVWQVRGWLVGMEPGYLVGKSDGLVIGRLLVRIPAEVVG